MMLYNHLLPEWELSEWPGTRSGRWSLRWHRQTPAWQEAVPAHWRPVQTPWYFQGPAPGCFFLQEVQPLRQWSQRAQLVGPQMEQPHPQGQQVRLWQTARGWQLPPQYR